MLRRNPAWPALAAVTFAGLVGSLLMMTFAPVWGGQVSARMGAFYLVMLIVIVTLFERRALIPADGRYAWGGIFALLGVGLAYVVWRGGEIPDELWREFGVGIAIAAARDELFFRGAIPALIDRYATVRDENQYPYRFGPAAWGLALAYGLFEGVQVIGADLAFHLLPFAIGFGAGMVLALVRAMTGTVLAPLALHVGVALLILGSAV